MSSVDRLSLLWHPSDCAGDGGHRAALAAALSANGAVLVDDDGHDGDDGPGPATIPGILLLTTCGPKDLAAVARASRAGQRRLIVALAGEAACGSPIDWQLLALGASDVQPWSMLLKQGEALRARLERWNVIDEIVASPLIRDNLVGSSTAWLSLLRRLVEVARFTTAPILLLGDSGTGKELLARLLHTLDARADKRDLIVLDCTTVMPELSGSEFFGHERGAFTNAHAPRDGAFALAHRGTLFLDEVGELPAAMQAQLLRVVQEHTFKRLGSNAWQRTEFRLVCATNRDLVGEAHGGGFRRDLYYRLAGWVFRVPNLSERRQDILPLARHFLGTACPELGAAPLAPSVGAWLQARDYPGNVRDLRQLMLRIGARHVGTGPIGLADIPEDERPTSTLPFASWPDQAFEGAVERAVSLGFGLREISRTASEVAVRAAMRSHGTLRGAARSLGVTDRALQLRHASTRDAQIGAARVAASSSLEAFSSNGCCSCQATG